MASVRVVEITRQQLEGLSAPPSNTATITQVEPISSYNWIEAATPTISVPGSPALWAPPPGPQRLKKDTGLVYIAQNAARHPDYPLEPLFRAVQITKPAFDLKAVDIVTDRNNIRKLLSFVNPNLGTNSSEPFTISIEMTGNTAIFCRQETKVQEFIGDHDFRGFGHEFEKAYTKSRVAGSTGHHRVIAYRFGGLKFVVRYETDGYVGTDATASPGGSSNSEKQANGLSSMLANMSLSPARSSSSIPPAGSKLNVRQQGDVVPLGSMLEIKTRISHKPLAIQDVAPQLWISQTPKLVRAYHQKGIFQKPEVEDVTKAIAVWEQNNSRDLVRLAALLRRILGIAKELGGSVVVRYENASKKLVISTVTRKRSLPDDLYSLWAEADTPKVISKSVSQAVEAGLVVGANPEPSLGDSIASGKSVPERQRVDIPFFDTITYCEQHGFRHFFRRMHPHLAEYRILCQSLDHLGVEGLKQRRLQDVIAELKTGDDDYDPEERRVIRGSKRKARDAAFALVYLFLMGNLESTPQDSNAAYNAVQYIVSHYRKFKPKTRKMVREAYEAKFVMTLKQRQGLDKWPITERGQDSEESTVVEDDSPFAWSSDESF